MNLQILPAALLVAVLCVAHGASRCVAATFSIPDPSRDVVGATTLQGEEIGTAWTRRFTECDTRNSVDGVLVKHKCSDDPNRNSVVLLVKNNVIFYDAKMGLDRDGSAHARLRKGTDQPETSLRYPTQGAASMDADRVPYIVVPNGFVDRTRHATPGDVAAVIHDNQLAFAVVGDIGLPYKIGEGSVRLHELLGHSVCRTRTATGDCDEAQESSIKQGVLYFVFLGTAFELKSGLTAKNIGERINALGSRHWQRLQESKRSR